MRLSRRIALLFCVAAAAFAIGWNVAARDDHASVLSKPDPISVESAGAGESESRVGEPIEVPEAAPPPVRPEASAASERQAASDPTLRAGPYDPARETLEQFQRRKFRRLIAQFDGEPIEAPDWPGFDAQQLAPLVLIQSVSVHLRAAGRAREGDPNVQRELARREGFEHVWDFEGTTVAFHPGEFPVYDEYVRLNALDPATQVPWDQPLPPRTFESPEPFFAEASKFAHEAMAKL